MPMSYISVLTGSPPPLQSCNILLKPFPQYGSLGMALNPILEHIGQEWPCLCNTSVFSAQSAEISFHIGLEGGVYTRKHPAAHETE